MKVRGIHHVGLVVDDLEAAVAFYGAFLGMEIVERLHGEIEQLRRENEEMRKMMQELRAAQEQIMNELRERR